MTDTAQFALPLLQPSQAQKHVTVNEALLRLDAMAELVLQSRSLGAPPGQPAEGAAYGLPASPSGAWEGHGGRIALFLNGGWVFVQPRRGWRAWIADEDVPALHDGATWRGGAVALSPSGAGSFFRIREFDHSVAPGETSVTAHTIPANCMVFAVTARVTQSLTGTLSAWALGNADAPERFGAGLSLSAGAFTRGLLAVPMSFYAAEPLVLTAAEGDFAAGQVRIAIHYFEASLPGE